MTDQVDIRVDTEVDIQVERLWQSLVRVEQALWREYPIHRSVPARDAGPRFEAAIGGLLTAQRALADVARSHLVLPEPGAGSEHLRNLALEAGGRTRALQASPIPHEWADAMTVVASAVALTESALE